MIFTPNDLKIIRECLKNWLGEFSTQQDFARVDSIRKRIEQGLNTGSATEGRGCVSSHSPVANTRTTAGVARNAVMADVV
jgi:hypothetical protein